MGVVFRCVWKNTYSSIKISDEQNGAVSNVVIRNLRHNGKIIEDFKQANFSIGPYVNGVRIEK